MPRDTENLLKDLVPPANSPATHDTVGVIALDDDGHIVTACSTSGLAFKLPGRVGDTPLPGNGYFADDCYGAAVATGMGEDIMRFSISRMAVEALADGKTPQQAAEEVLGKCLERCDIREWIGLLVADTKGNWGAACSVGEFYVSHAESAEKADIALFQGMQK